MNQETFAPAPEPYAARYEVGSHGTVRDVTKGRTLRQTRSTVGGLPGYMKVSLWSKTTEDRKLISVHRLVASVFVPGDHSLDVNHKDMDKVNNRFTNLEWVTHAENIRHGMRNSFTWLDRLRVAGRMKCRPVIATNLETNEETRYDSVAHAARALGHVNKSGNICHAIEMGNVAYGAAWKHALIATQSQ